MTLRKKATDPVRLLNEKLVEATRVFTEQSEEVGQILTIHALLEFLEVVGIEPRLRQPLFSLHGMLVDKNRVGAEAKLSVMTKVVSTAVTLDNLIKSGVRRDEAARQVSKAVDGAVTSTQIINYRQNLQRHRARPDAIAMYSDMVRESDARWSKLSSADRAREALESLRQAVVSGRHKE